MKVRRKYGLEPDEYDELAALCKLLSIDLKQMVTNDLRHFIKEHRYLLAKKETQEVSADASPKKRRNWIEIDTK